jgi:hypothetical protein
VLTLLRVNQDDLNDILGVRLSKGEFEIRCEIIDYLIFRQHIISPEIFVKTTLEKFAKGLASKINVSKAASRLLTLIWGDVRGDG